MKPRLILTILLLAWALLASCAPADGTLEIYITKSPNTGQVDPLDPNWVTHLRIHITGPDMDPFEDVFEFEAGGQSSLTQVPAGERRIITVEGLAGADGLAFSRGRTLPLKIKSGLQTIDLFMARTGRFSLTPGTGLVDSRFAAATTLDANGTVWIAGGGSSGSFDNPAETLATIETYDPTSGATRMAPCSNETNSCLVEPRAHAAAVSLTSSILVLGGKGDDTLASVAIEVSLNKGTATESSLTQVDRYGAVSILMGEQTLIVGGLDQDGNALADAELIGNTGQIELLTMPAYRKWHVGAPALDQGFIFAGEDEDDLASSDFILFDFSSKTFSQHTSMVTARSHASIASFSDGRVLIAGGIDESGTVIGDVDLYDPQTKTICNVGQLQRPRYLASAVALPEGGALIMGGLIEGTSNEPTSSAEIFDPRFIDFDETCNVSPAKLVGRPVPDLEIARYGATSVLLPNETTLVVGGLDRDGLAIKHLEAYVME